MTTWSERLRTSSAKELGDGPLPFTEGAVFKVRRSNGKAGAGHCIRAFLEQLHHSLADDGGSGARLVKPGHGAGLAAVPTPPTPSPTTSACGQSLSMLCHRVNVFPDSKQEKCLLIN